MAVVAITSFSGAPGCTTLAVAWSYLNPRPTLLLEADPTGGSPVLAGPFRAELYHDSSVLNLADYAGEALVQALWHHAYPLPDAVDRRALPTVAAHHQARAMGAVWPAIARAARELAEEGGTDVVIDLGRHGMEYSPAALLAGADLVICLTDATLPALNSARWGLESLREDLARTADPDRVALVTTRPRTGTAKGFLSGRRDPAPAARPWSTSEIRSVVQPTPVLADLPFDRASAQVYSHGTPGPRDPGDTSTPPAEKKHSGETPSAPPTNSATPTPSPRSSAPTPPTPPDSALTSTLTPNTSSTRSPPNGPTDNTPTHEEPHDHPTAPTHRTRGSRTRHGHRSRMHPVGS